MTDIKGCHFGVQHEAKVVLFLLAFPVESVDFEDGRTYKVHPNLRPGVDDES